MRARRLILVLLTASVATLAMSVSEASAHLRSGTVAVDYRAALMTPRTAAYQAVTYQSDRGLSLTLHPGHVVVLLGYLGEPVFRLDPAGAWINDSSPTAAAVGLLKQRQLVRGSTPRWHLEAGHRSVLWHDARAAGLPAGIDHNTWQVPLLVDGRRELLTGELRRVPAPALWPWLSLVAGGLIAATLSTRRRPDRTAAHAMRLAVLATAAMTVVALTFALDTYASPGTWIAGLDEIAFAAAGLWALLRGPAVVQTAIAIGLGLLACAVALSKGAVFFHPIVLAVLPSTVMRLLVALAFAAGSAAAGLGAAHYARSPSQISQVVREYGQRVDRAHGRLAR